MQNRDRYDFAPYTEGQQYTSDPPNPAEGNFIIWQASGNAGTKGAKGDLMIKTTTDGTTLIGYLTINKFLNENA